MSSRLSEYLREKGYTQPQPLLTEEKIRHLAELVEDDHGGATVMRSVLVSIFYGKGFRLQDVRILDGENFQLMLDLLEYERQTQPWPQEIIDLAAYAKKRMGKKTS